MTVVIQPDCWRKLESRTSGRAKADDRREVMRGIFQAKAVAVTQSTIHFGAGREVLTAEGACVRSCRQRKRPAHSEGITELPRLVSQIFFGDDVLRDIPAFEVAGEDQF